MSGMRSDEPGLSELFVVEEALRIVRELAMTGCVQPMTQAKTAIHSETAVAIPTLIM